MFPKTSSPVSSPQKDQATYQVQLQISRKFQVTEARK